MSAPEMKAFSPSPVMTIRRTSGSASNAAIALGSAVHMSCETALNLVGLEKITQPTAFSLRVMSSAMLLLQMTL